MAEYGAYTDGNGVKWTIITTGSQLFATMPAEANPRYVPDPPDLGPVTMLSAAKDGDTEAERTEAARKSFLNLREVIDTWAADVDHKKQVALVVTPDKTPSYKWVIALLLIIAAASD